MSWGGSRVNGREVHVEEHADGMYSLLYTVMEGDSDRDEWSPIPVSLVVVDPSGNSADAYTSSPTPCASIDANTPRIVSMRTAPSFDEGDSLRVNDTLSIFITVDDGDVDSGMIAYDSTSHEVLYSTPNEAALFSSINGVPATDFTEWGGGVYSFDYTVNEGDRDCRADDTTIF